MSDEDEIVVTGPSPYTPPPDPPQTGPTPTPTGGPPPPGSPGGPPPVQLEGNATSFAAARVRTSPSLGEIDATEALWVSRGTSIMKGLYFNTQFGEKTTINGPGTNDMAETDFAALLAKTTITLTTDFVADTGARAVAYSNGQYEIQIDIDNPKVVNFISSFPGESGAYFIFFHELGHLMGHNLGVNSEANASTFALGLADYASFGLPSQASLEAIGINFSGF